MEFDNVKNWWKDLVSILNTPINPDIANRFLKVTNDIHSILNEDSYKHCQEYHDFMSNYSYADVHDLVIEKNESCDLLTNESILSLISYVNKVYVEIGLIIDKDRFESLQECYEVYRIGAYKACALLVLSQIEGIMNQCIQYKEISKIKHEAGKDKSSKKGLHSKKEKMFSYKPGMYDPFPAFNQIFNILLSSERNEMSHHGVVKDAKIKSFFFLLMLLSVAANIRHIFEGESLTASSEEI